MTRARAALVVSLVLVPWPAAAQPELFVEGVRELVSVSELPGPARGDALRAVAGRLGTALREWDRRLATARHQVARDAAGATAAQAARMRVDLGRSYLVRGQVLDALGELEAAVAHVPESSEAHLWRAQALEMVGRPAESAAAFVAAWTLDAGSMTKAYYVAQRATAAPAAERTRARAALSQAYAHLDVNTVPSAPPFGTVDLITDALSPGPVIGDGATSEAFALLRAGRLDEAVVSLQRRSGAAAAPVSAGARDHFARAQRHEAANQVAEARREYEATLPGVLFGRSAIWVAIGRLAQVDGDPEAAIAAFERAARLAPNDPHVRRELADAYTSQSRPDDALAELIATLIVSPRDAFAHAAIGSLFLDADRPADAVAALTRALELMPSRYQPRYTLARALDRLGRPQEAARERALFEKARLASLGQRRRIMATDLEKEEALLREQGGAK